MQTDMRHLEEKSGDTIVKEKKRTFLSVKGFMKTHYPVFCPLFLGPCALQRRGETGDRVMKERPSAHPKVVF